LKSRLRRRILRPVPPAAASSLSGAKVLVTGATGFVGSVLASRLVREGAAVRGLTRDPSSATAIYGVEWMRGALEKPSSLVAATRGVDVVFHAGGMVGHYGIRSAYLRANVDGTRDLLAASRANGVGAFVFTSTPSVIADGTDHFGVNEDHAYSPRFASPYPESKALSEQLVLAAHGASGMRTIVVRPHMIWGPGRSQWVQGMLRRARRNALRRIGHGRNRIGMTFLDDCVEAHICASRALLADPGVGGVPYFIHGGGPVVFWDWVAELVHACGLHPIRGEVPAGIAMAIAHLCDAGVVLSRGRWHAPVSAYLISELTTDHYSDITRARERLGYRPKVSMAEGIARIAAAERAKARPATAGPAR
jgi:nucleoside-diphosphate-sugar epimerase